MPLKIRVKFVGPWAGVLKAYDPAVWTKKFQKEAMRATRINGAIVRRVIRKAIRNARSHSTKLAGLTAAIKGSSRPLWDSGELHNSVTFSVKNWGRVHVGVLRTAGPRVQNIAKVVHSGHEIKITSKMRKMFALLHAVSRGWMESADITSPRARELWSRFSGHSPGAVWPTLKGRRVIDVPPRPFVKWALEDGDMNKIPSNYLVALIRAFVIPGASKGNIPTYLVT